MGHTGNSMDMGAMNGSYSFDGFLAGLLVLLIKLLMIALVIAVIVGIFIWLRNNLFSNSDSQFVQTLKNDPIVKTALFVTTAFLLIILVLSMIAGLTNPGTGWGFGTEYMMGAYDSTTIGIYEVLSLFVKLLSFIFILSLIFALLAFVKKQYDAGLFDISKASGASDALNKENTSNQNNEGTV